MFFIISMKGSKIRTVMIFCILDVIFSVKEIFLLLSVNLLEPKIANDVVMGLKGSSHCFLPHYSTLHFSIIRYLELAMRGTKHYYFLPAYAGTK